MTLLCLALAMCIVGTIASVVAPAAIGRALGFALLGLAGTCASAAAIEQLRANVPVIAGNSTLHAVLRLDATAAFFIAIIGVIAMLVAVFGLGPRTIDERRTGRTAAATACAIAFASLLACSADDVLLFIFAWELLALCFYWAIAYGGTDTEAPRAAYLTIVVTHAAGACIIGALLFLTHMSGSFAIDSVVAAGRMLNPTEAGVILLLLLLGFGAKFGMLPMQVWLPYGYRAAPSLVAALMAGGALNVGFYGVTRFIVAFPTPPGWFAVVTIGLGALSAFFGITWACGQNDMRRLAAYSSVENGGVILAAFGVAIAGKTLKIDMLVGFAIAAAFAQIAAHAIAKSTLFLGISTIQDRCCTVSLDRLGGLARSMPITTLAILACGMSLTALPPLAGFVGEWLVLESLMQAFRTGNAVFEIVFALAGAIIGVTAGISVVAFTKLVGIGLLGAARSKAAREATQTHSPWQLAGLLLGTGGIVAGGVLAAPLLKLAAPSIDGVAHASAVAAIVGTVPLVQPTFAGFSSISAPGLGCVILGFTLVFWLAARLFVRPRERRTSVWTSGEPYSPRDQYTGTGYVNPTRVVLDAGMRTVREVAVEPRGDGRTSYNSEIRPFFDISFYRGASSLLLRVAEAVRATQSGVIAAYLSYILVFTILLLILYPSIRHW
jgi:hydrogenase-4 component B